MAVRVRIPHEARTAQRRVLPGATATVNYYGGGAAPVYMTESATVPWVGLATLPQPLVAGPDGKFPGYVPPGRYSVAITFGGSTETHEWNALAAGPDGWAYIGLDGGATSFLNSWTFYTVGSWPAYRKTSEGLVLVQGAVAGGAMFAPAFTMPTGYRPVQTWLFPATSFAALGRIDALADGSITPNQGNNTVQAFSILYTTS